MVLYRVSDLKQLAVISTGAELALSAIAISHDSELLAVAIDAPDSVLSIWRWRDHQELARAPLQQPTAQLSFHPADGSLLCTVAPGSSSSSSSNSSSESSNRSNGSTVADSSGGRSGVVNGVAHAAGAQLWRLQWLWQRHELTATELQLGGRVATCHAWAPEVSELAGCGHRSSTTASNSSSSSTDCGSSSN